MALLSFSVPAAKGSSSLVTLNKSELLGLSEVSADAYWSVSANIKTATIYFRSTIGRQKKVLNFDFSLASPEAVLAFSARARDAFVVQKILLRDFDNGSFVLDRSEMSGGTVSAVSSFDITFSSGSGSVTVSSLWKGENVNPVFPTDAVFTSNTASYSVTSGVMTLALNMSATSAGFVGGNIGLGRYYIDIPGGYSLAPSVNVGDILGTGIGGHGAASFPVRGEVTTMASVKRIGLWIPAFDTTWWQHWFGSFFYAGAIDINLTITFAVV